MQSNLFDRRSEDVLESILADCDGPVYFVNPTGDVLEDVVETARTFDGAPADVRVLGDGRIVRRVMDDFLISSSAAELVDAGRLEVRIEEDLREGGNTLVVTDDAVLALVTTGGLTAGLTATDGEFVDDARERYLRKYETAETYEFRTPAISSVRETLDADLGSDTREDFTEVLASMETARGDGEGLDEVTISLLVAAKNDELFYDISRWGEDVGVASKATFSRVKNDLEESGLIETEKVPVDVGRPRQRLTIADQRLQDASSDQVASVAESILG